MSKGDDTKQQILELASARAAQFGLEGLSIGTLATELQMSKSGLFAHFKSKSALQVQVLQFEADAFVSGVIHPALRAPRGEARVRALMQHWVTWFRDRRPGGCLFVAAATELDDRPCEARDFLVGQQNDWLEFIASVVRTAVQHGDFRADLDPEQFAYEMYSIPLMLHFTARLLRDPKSFDRASSSFEALLDRARVPSPS